MANRKGPKKTDKEKKKTKKSIERKKLVSKPKQVKKLVLTDKTKPKKVPAKLKPPGKTGLKPIKPVEKLEIKELNTQIKRKLISDKIIEKLKKKKIKTFNDIRRNGGIPPLKDISSKEKESLKRITAHAYLSLVCDDLKLNQKLIDKGFNGIAEIGGMGKGLFIKEAEKAGIQKKIASLIHAKAKTQMAILNNIYTGLRVEQANGLETKLPINLPPIYLDQCECRECESAVSPLAYLTDLLNYVMVHVFYNNGDLNVETLQDTFLQSFGKLTTCCDEVNRKVKQARICIEVLREYLKEHQIMPNDLLEEGIKKYLFSAYTIMLNNIGISYQELRLARTAETEKRKSLADRLGIPLEHLDSLYLSHEAITEEKLEQLFGLQDTTRNPLSDGAKLGDDSNQIVKWKFYGVEWNRNTDINGNIYTRIKKDAHSPDFLKVNLYRDKLRTKSVAYCRVKLSDAKTLKFLETNNSGLSGSFEMNFFANFYADFSVIPDFLSWRLQYLRNLWYKQDWPSDPYIKEPSEDMTEQDLLPIIDPDIIGPEDFRVSNTDISPIFDLWIKRREWVDGQIQELANMKKVITDEQNEEIEIPDLEAMFQRMYEPISYPYPLPHTIIPWKNTTPPEAFDSINDILTEGTDTEVEKAINRIKDDLCISVESFIRLLELRDKELAWEVDQSKEQFNRDEWEEFYSILAQVQKKVLFNFWRQEETNLEEQPIDNENIPVEVLFSPKHFWFSLCEPQEGIWSPTLHGQRPLIDPEVTKLEDLMTAPIGLHARNVWLSRSETMKAIREEIENTYEISAEDRLENLLLNTLGQPPDNTTWVELVTQIKNDLDSLDTQTRENAKKQVEEKFYMSLEDFAHLVTIKMKEDEPGLDPSEEELETLYTILTTARKKRTLVSDWKQEEENENFLYWKILKARLPLWRSSMEIRKLWQYALRTRSKKPVIDPDLIGDDDLKEPTPGNAPHDILQARKEWIGTLINDLKTLREKELAYILWGSQGNQGGQFQNPRGVAVDSNGNIYVVERSNHRVQKFDSTGTFLKKWGSRGTGEGKFRYPQGVAVDDNDNIYVVDSVNNRVQKFDSEGQFLKTWGVKGESDGQFNNPLHITIDNNGYVYVTDSSNHRVQKFDLEGNFVTKWGSHGSGNGKFDSPFGVAADIYGNIYVTDAKNCRVQKFDSQGNFLLKWGSIGDGSGQFKSPAGIAVDSNNHVYVADYNTNCIKKFDSGGTFLEKWGRLGNEEGRFKSPSGITVNSSGNVYVAENGNHRIQILLFGPAGSLQVLLKYSLGVGVNNMTNLAVEYKQGNDITSRLDQLNLNIDAFLYLVRVNDLIHSGTEILESEWNDVYSILVQVTKHRNFTDWKNTEKDNDILLSQDFFQIAGNELELPPWRADRESRWDWEDKLGTRINQEKNTITAMAEAVDGCEEDTMTMLRDTLIDASDAEGDELAERAKWLTDRLLIDFQVAPCRKTTRVSQALTTLQNLVFSLRTGQLEEPQNTIFELDPEYECFDEEWIWIGSYETWKAAVGVFLYPENILLPSLRYNKTPAFIKLLSDLQGPKKLMPERAREIAKLYADYFNDVCHLEVQATCMAKTTIDEGEDETRQLFYMFALGREQKKIYWSHLKPAISISVTTKTFWEELPISELGGFADVIGAVPYYENESNRYIFLFLVRKIKGKNNLVFVRYDLDKRRWDQEIQTLETPQQTTDFTAHVKQANRTDVPPHIAIRLQDGTIYERLLNLDGTGWADGDWVPLIGKSKGKEFTEICGFFESWGVDYLIAGSMENISYRLLGYKDDGSWRAIDEGVYHGTLQLMGEDPDSWYVFYKKDREGYKKIGTLGTKTESMQINNITDLNNWINEVYGLSFQSYKIYAYWREGDKRFLNLYDLLCEPEPEGDTELLSLKRSAVDSFIKHIKGSDYSDEVVGEWKLVAETVTEISGAPSSFEDMLYIIVLFKRQLEFYKRSADQVSTEQQIFEIDIIIPPSWGYASGVKNFGREYSIFVYQSLDQSGNRDLYSACNFWPSLPTTFLGSRIAPKMGQSIGISDRITPDIVQTERAQLSKEAYEENSPWLNVFSLYNNIEWVNEAFYFVPMAISLKLLRSGQYKESIDWLRTVYDYTRPLDIRKIYYGLEYEETYESGFAREDEWLRDPLDIHAIASTRKNNYTRFTLISLIRCLLAYADAEFTRDTVESLPKAMTLYETSFELLGTPELNQHFGLCEDIIGYLEIEIEDPEWQGAWNRILYDMGQIKDINMLKITMENVSKIMQSSKELSVRITEAQRAVNEVLGGQQPETIRDIIKKRNQTFTEIPKILLKNESIENSINRSTLLIENSAVVLADEAETVNYVLPIAGGNSIPTAAALKFCIPSNPMINALRFHAGINLYKIRTCRNIAGVKREIEVYAAPTDILSAMPAIGPGGQLIVPNRITPPPVPYRYEFIIERAKQLVNIGMQIEASLLAALEKRDIEFYNLLEAKQDVQLARAGVKLQNLRIRQAKDEVELAELQRESAEIQTRTYKGWLEVGLSQWEEQMISGYKRSETARIMSAFFDFGVSMFQAAASASGSMGAGAPAAFMAGIMAGGRYMSNSIAIAAETQAQVAAVWASYERRAQEWQLQKELSEHAIRIGDQQIKIASDGVNIMEKEGEIARIQVEHAEAIVEFLQNKFTSVELYDWMSSILESIYSFFLQHATSMAKLAQNQLAFERQELPPAYIQNDYWEVPSEDSIGGASEDSIDRHGLTGSARLMADIYKLDQYKLETEKRKLQLSKTISLARMSPYEFQRFRETGVMPFETSMELFDRDFPGHYLRMVKKVSTSIIALIPPTQGIKATISNIGVSRLVVNRNMLFQTITAYRPPESIALTSPTNATGLFEMETQSAMLLPFEGLGVDTNWELRMPKTANPFDYNTISDVLITIEYTALDNPDYRQQAIEKLPSKVSAARPLSFKQQLPDQWYELHNPDQSVAPMVVSFKTSREEFPPNLERLKIDHLLLYFAGSDEELPEIEVTLNFSPEGNSGVSLGGSASAVDGIISTRRGNAGSWTLMQGETPCGEWQLDLSGNPLLRSLFEDGKIEDILFVITFSGRLPEWPE